MVLEREKKGHRLFPGVKLGFRLWAVQLTLFSNWCGLRLCLCSVRCAYVVFRSCGEVLTMGMIFRYMELSGEMGLSGTASSEWWSLE